MDIDVFQTRELPIVFRALRTALAPDGTLQPRERLFLETYARIVAWDLPRDELAPIAPERVWVDGAHPRKRLLQLSAIAVLLSRPVKEASLAFLEALAMHLGTYDPVIDAIKALRKGQYLKVRLIGMRRAMRAMFKEAYQAEGLPGMLRLFAAMWFKAPVNTKKLKNYKRLGLLAEGTLGREYWKFMTQEGFNFPGEPAGIPASVAYHDIAHVMTGHPATPLGEIQQGSFQGGNRREDGFFFIQFVILQFHHGVKITPQTFPTFDLFDPEKVLWAIHRGAQCNVDMTHQWNFWPLMTLPLAEARARVALLPKLPERSLASRRLELVHERIA
jgi:ubiquinone biosynthesis protein Coq4